MPPAIRRGLYGLPAKPVPLLYSLPGKKGGRAGRPQSFEGGHGYVRSAVVGLFLAPMLPRATRHHPQSWSTWIPGKAQAHLFFSPGKQSGLGTLQSCPRPHPPLPLCVLKKKQTVAWWGIRLECGWLRVAHGSVGARVPPPPRTRNPRPQIFQKKNPHPH